MIKEEAKIFIDEMKKIGDCEWTLDEVIDVYGRFNLQDAISMRKKELEMFNDVDKKISELNIKNY